MIAVVRESEPEIRHMRQADIPKVHEIECAAYDFPWSIGIFRDCLLADYMNLILERDGEVIGYAIMSVAAGEAHLLNICVANELRRRGYGRIFLEHMLDLAQSASAQRIYLEVRPSNKAALALYESRGFAVLGIREHYYRAHEGKEDAVVLVYHFPKRGDKSASGE